MQSIDGHRKSMHVFMCSGASDVFSERWPGSNIWFIFHFSVFFSFPKSFSSTNADVGLGCLKALSINHKWNTVDLEKVQRAQRGRSKIWRSFCARLWLFILGKRGVGQMFIKILQHRGERGEGTINHSLHKGLWCIKRNSLVAGSLQMNGDSSHHRKLHCARHIVW